MQDGERPEASHSGPHARRSKALLLGLAAVAVAVAVPLVWTHQHAQHAATPPPGSATSRMGAPATGEAPPGVRLADFRGEQPSPDARVVANWVVVTGNNHRHAIILVDKKDARVYVFRPDGELQDSAPALLGEAAGDAIPPGTGDKPLSEIKPDEKTTPAGRFVAEPGVNADNEDVIWVDYDDAISMHRVRPNVASEHRLERLASLATDDNRISFGCINLPVSFYEDVAKPAVTRYGAVIYVLPEVKSIQQVFGAYDVTDPDQVAAARHATVANAARAAAKGAPQG